MRQERRRESCTVLVLNPQCGQRDHDLVEATLTSSRLTVSTNMVSTRMSRSELCGQGATVITTLPT